MSDAAHGVPIADIFGAKTAEAMRQVRSATGYDVLRSPGFWEAWISTQFGGDQTPHKHPFDVLVNIWGKPCQAEVKFSRAFHAQYNEIKGKNWSRNMFKWALSALASTRGAPDGVVLIGVDVDDLVYAWVVPPSAIPAGKRALTATAFSSRASFAHGRLDPWLVPATDILPAFAHVAHNAWDQPHRAVNASLTRKLKAGQPDLFPRDDPHTPASGALKIEEADRDA